MMKKIEQGMYELHAHAKKAQPQSMEIDQPGSTATVIAPHIEETPPPFCKPDEVAEGSPAYAAGIHVNDMIFQFGSINKTNCGPNLRAIGELVLNSEGRHIIVKLKRIENGNEVVKTVNVVPKKWSGRGLLGYVDCCLFK
jgi:hypothetical protein